MKLHRFGSRWALMLAACAALALSIGIATAAASTGSQQICASNGGTYSTKAGSSIFAPSPKKQGVLWTCNGYTGGSATTQALVTSCFSTDGGKGLSAQDGPPGDATCWVNPFPTVSASEQLCEDNGGTYSTDRKSTVFAPEKKQGMLWTCDGYTGGSATTQALVTSCFSTDGGQGLSAQDGPPGDATCWSDPFSS